MYRLVALPFAAKRLDFLGDFDASVTSLLLVLVKWPMAHAAATSPDVIELHLWGILLIRKVTCWWRG